MKKKIQIRHQSPPPQSILTVDLKHLIKSHRSFFDTLIDLIPAKFYLPSNEDDKPWFQGLSKAAKASAKRQTKENIKKSKLERLDPEKCKESTVELLNKAIEKDGKETDEEEDEDNECDDVGEKVLIEGGFEDGDGVKDGEKGKEGSVTYEELKERLHCKLEELRANRGQGKRFTMSKDRFNTRGMEVRKRKRGDDEVKEGKVRKVEVGKGKVEEMAKGIEFGKVKLGGEEKRKKKKKGNKWKELENAKRLEEVRKDPVRGNKTMWNLAERKAMGEKVHDNPRLIKESIKKEMKKKAKSAEAWKERADTTKNLRNQYQKKRAENITGRIEDKKRRKIEKREKKLMRPGFEGRKEGYIGDK